MSALTNGRYRILSLVEDPNPPTGITDHALDSAPVRLNQPDQIWTITPLPTQGLRLSIGRFPYTGAESEVPEFVIATLDSSKDVAWFFTFIERQSAYIITKDLERTKGWTVFGANAPDAPIVIQPIIVTSSDPPLYLTSQLFRVLPILDD